MTTGTVYVDAVLKDARGAVVVLGRTLLGQNATINPRDIELTHIKSIVFQPWGGQQRFAAGSIGSLASKDYFREFNVIQGSIGSLGILDTSTGVGPLGNYVRVKTWRVKTLGSMTARAAAAQGTKGLYIGTQSGSVRSSFWAVGQ